MPFEHCCCLCCNETKQRRIFRSMVVKQITNTLINCCKILKKCKSLIIFFLLSETTLTSFKALYVAVVSVLPQIFPSFEQTAV